MLHARPGVRSSLPVHESWGRNPGSVSKNGYIDDTCVDYCMWESIDEVFVDERRPHTNIYEPCSLSNKQVRDGKMSLTEIHISYAARGLPTGVHPCVRMCPIILRQG